MVATGDAVKACLSLLWFKGSDTTFARLERQLGHIDEIFTFEISQRTVLCRPVLKTSILDRQTTFPSAYCLPTYRFCQKHLIMSANGNISPIQGTRDRVRHEQWKKFDSVTRILIAMDASPTDFQERLRSGKKFLTRSPLTSFANHARCSLG